MSTNVQVRVITGEFEKKAMKTIARGTNRKRTGYKGRRGSRRKRDHSRVEFQSCCCKYRGDSSRGCNSRGHPGDFRSGNKRREPGKRSSGRTGTELIYGKRKRIRNPSDEFVRGI